MHNTNTEHQPQSEDTRTPEDIERSNAERQDVLSGLYSPDRLASQAGSEAGRHMDERKVFGAMDDKTSAQELGVSEARSDVARAYDAMISSGSPEAAAVYAQEAVVKDHVEAAMGAEPDDETVAVRVGAEVLTNVGDGSANRDNAAVLGAEDMTKVTRAVVAANLIEQIEQNSNTELENFTTGTKARISRFLQMVRNRGGPGQTSNHDLADAGRYIEQNPEVAKEVTEAEIAVEPELSREEYTQFATVLVRGGAIPDMFADTLTPDARRTIEAYVAANQSNLPEGEATVVATVEEMIAEATREVADTHAA